MRSFLYRKDVAALLQALGCIVRNTPLLGPNYQLQHLLIIDDDGPTDDRTSLTIN
jgi:hypothetical protein